MGGVSKQKILFFKCANLGVLQIYVGQLTGLSGFEFSVFHEDINLISYFLARVLIGHGYFDLQV